MACRNDHTIDFRPRATTGGTHQNGADGGAGVVVLGAAELVSAVVVRDDLVCPNVRSVVSLLVVAWAAWVVLVYLGRWFWWE